MARRRRFAPRAEFTAEPRARPWLRAVVWSVLGLIPLLGFLVFGVLWLTVPPDNQTLRVAGLSAPVTITFDGNGVPWIRAANERDAATALGFVHARDRMFQMELMRRAASGRLAELVGPAALPIDKQMRVLGLARLAEGDVAAQTPETRGLLEAYAAGVNAWISSRGRFAAMEFLFFGVPEPWKLADSLLWGRTMSLWLSTNYRTELTRQALREKVPQRLLEQLWPPHPGPLPPEASRTDIREADAGNGPGERHALLRSALQGPPERDSTALASHHSRDRPQDQPSHRAGLVDDPIPPGQDAFAPRDPAAGALINRSAPAGVSRPAAPPASSGGPPPRDPGSNEGTPGSGRYASIQSARGHRGNAAAARLSAAAAAVLAALPAFPAPFTLPSSASDAWAVDGRWTDTGAPLLAGDPHLSFDFPGLWYLVRIETPERVLVGATGPGAPFLVMGHNGRIAWTFTTSGADTQDIYLEPSNVTFTTREERIKVRGQPDTVLTVRETRHGPVISDLMPGNGPIMAVAMTNLLPRDTGPTGLVALNQARTVEEAGAAAPLIAATVQNLMVADRTTIGLFVTGRVPIRRTGDGWAPVPGTSALAVVPPGPTQVPEARTPAARVVTGQTPSGQTPAIQTLAGQTPINQTPINQTLTGQTPTGQTPINQTLTGQTPTGQTPASQTLAGQSTAGQTEVGQTSAGQTQVGQTRIGRIAVGHAAAGPSRTGQSATGQSPFGHSATGPSATGQGPAGQGAATRPPAGRTPLDEAPPDTNPAAPPSSAQSSADQNSALPNEDDDPYGWIGFASGEALPHVVAPASGRLVNANEPVAAPDFPVFMGRDTFRDWRARRIRALLDSTPIHSTSDFAAMQTDVISTYAAALLPMLRVVPGAPQVLRDWDGAMTENAPQPLIFSAWMEAFHHAVLARAGIAIWASAPVFEFVPFVLSPQGASWCGGDCAPLLKSTLDSTMSSLIARFGSDPTTWRWGAVHQAVFAHPLLRSVPVLGALTTSRIAVPGDGTTLDRGGTNEALEAVHGASFRGVYDLADLDRSLFMMTPGQSGNPLSRHARDFLMRWRDGAMVLLARLPVEVSGTVRLEP